MDKRPPKKTDQENIEIAYKLFNKLMNSHPEIEKTLWASVCWSSLVNGYKDSGSSYEEFHYEATNAINHYKTWWE
jgi:hypothetical protein